MLSLFLALSLVLGEASAVEAPSLPWQAVRHADQGALLQWMRQGRNLNFQDANGNTPLMFALRDRNFGLARWLIHNGADLHPARTGRDDFGGWRALDFAIEAQQFDLAKWMVEQGAPVNGLNFRFESPLMRAARYGQIALVETLLAKGAQVNQVRRFNDDFNAWTPLMYAIAFDHPAVAKRLLSAGADVNLRNGTTAQSIQEGGVSALFMALRMNQGELAREMIIRGADLKEQDYFGQTLLTLAAGQGDLETVRLLLKKGGNLNHVSDNGETALISALNRNQSTAVIKQLLKMGARVDQGRNGHSALISAVRSGRQELVELIVAKGARPRAYPMLLHDVVYRDQVSLLRWLIQKGALVNGRDFNQQTPVFAAIMGNKQQALTLLKQAGADLNAQDAQGITPLMSAVYARRLTLFTQLLKWGAKTQIKDTSGQTVQQILHTQIHSQGPAERKVLLEMQSRLTKY